MKKTVLTIVILMLALTAFSPFGLAYPERPITMIVPYGVGGGTDIVGRILARQMELHLGSPVIVDNKVGAGGAVGFNYVAQAAPDGYTILLVALPIVTLPVFQDETLTHNDLNPIALVNEDSAAIIVDNDSPWQTLDDVVQAGQERRLLVGTTSPGAAWWIGAQIFKQATGIQAVDVPYAAGAAPMLTALAGGEIDVATCSAAEATSMLESGEVRILAILSDERLPFFPDIPTAKELGYEASFGTWRGIMTPLGVSEEVEQVLKEAVEVAAYSEEFQNFLFENKYGFLFYDQAEFQAYMDAQFELFSEIAASLE